MSDSQVGAYVLEDKLGGGAAGEVYRARRLDGGSPVALKLLGASEVSLEARIRFEHEVRILSRLSHPNVVALKDHGIWEGRPYLAMELLPGAPLSTWLKKRGPFSAVPAAEIVRQAALALAHAHTQGILHRDVKPSNLMLHADGDTVTVKLVDFGLGRLREEAPSETAGTFLYMAPEQIGVLHRPVDERSDLYSLGMLAYEALTGEPAFVGKSLQELIHAHAAVMPPPPAGTPPGLWQIVLRLFQKDPEDRYRTARGAAADLAEFSRRMAEGNGAAFELGRHDWATDLAPPSFAGREAELARLRSAYDEVKANGDLKLAAVSGPSGMGKSRLAQELQATCVAAGGVFLSGRGRAYGQAAAYGLFAEALRSLASRHLRAEVVERVRVAVGDLGGEVIRLVPELQAVLGDVPPLAELEPARRQQRFFAVLTRLLGALGSREAPLLLFLDDLQWADEGSLALLKHLGKRGRQFPALLLIAYRTEEDVEPVERVLASLEDGGTGMVRVHLGPLTLEAIGKLTASMLGAAPPELAERVLERCGGSPLFAAECLRAFRDVGALVRTETGWVVDSARLAQAAYAGGLIDILLGRIARLEPHQRDLLTVAAVAGKEFDLAVVQSAAGGPDDDTETLRALLQAVDAAEEHQLVIPLRGSRYAFAHDKVREAFYDSLDAARRAGLHGRVGLALEMRSPGDSYPLAYHFGRSEDSVRAVRYAIDAGHRANEAYAHVEALRFFDHAEERWPLLPPEAQDPAQRIRMLEGISDACSMIGRYERALRCYQEILSSGVQGLTAAAVLGKIGAVHFRKGTIKAAIQALIEALEALGERFPRGRWGTAFFLAKEMLVHVSHLLRPIRRPPSADPVHQAIGRIYGRLIYALYFSDAFSLFSASLRYVNLMERHQILDGLGQAYTGYGVLCCSIPWFGRGLRYTERAIEIRKRQGDRWGIAQAQYFHQLCLQWAGRYQEARAGAVICKPAFEQLGDRWELCATIHGIAYMDFHLGRWHKVGPMIQELLAIAEEVGDVFSIARATKVRGEMSALLGSEQCLVEVDKSLALATETDNVVFCVVLRGVKGQILLRLGRAEEAVATVEEAVELIHRRRQRIEHVMKCYPTLADAYLTQAEVQTGPEQRRAWLEKARPAVQAALRRGRRFATIRSYGLRMQARLLWLTGRRRQALRAFRQAYDHAIQQGVPYDEALARWDMGRFLHAAGDPRGRSVLEAALAILRTLGATEDIERVQRLLGDEHAEAHREAPASGHGVRSEARSPIEAARFSSLLEIGQELSSTLEPNALVDKILASAVKVLGAERGILFLNDAKGAGLLSRAVYGASAEEFPASSSVADEVFRTGKTLALADAQTDSRFHVAASVVASGVRWILCAPLRLKAKSIGVLYLDNRLVRGQFTEADRAVLQALASQAAIALHNANAFADLERTKKELSGLLPICASCKRIRDDTGYWSQIETYIAEHSEADFSHGICPECISELYPEFAHRLAARARPPSTGSP